MAGSKKTVVRSKGGILNDSDGVIKGYQITTDTPFENAGGYFYNIVSIQEDNKDDVTTHALFMGGSADTHTVSKDGRQLTPDDGKPGVGSGLANTIFMESFDAALEEAGEEGGAQADLGEDDATIDYSPIIGARCRFIQQPLDESELAALKAKGKATVRKAANGKSYPLTKTVVSKFYGFEAVSKPKTGPKAVNKTASAPKTVAEVKAAMKQRATA